MEVHKNFFSKFLYGLINNLLIILPKEIQYFYFPNSGAEAVDGAIKLAYKYHQGKEILFYIPIYPFMANLLVLSIDFFK